MKKKITKILAAVAIVFAGLLVPMSGCFAAGTVDACANASAEAKAALGCSGNSDIAGVVRNILVAVIGVCGTVAVVYIVIGGFKYMTSMGDAGKLQSAKNTILYACIGLIVCALAFAIVNFTVGIVNGNTSAGGEPETVVEESPEE